MAGYRLFALGFDEVAGFGANGGHGFLALGTAHARIGTRFGRRCIRIEPVRVGIDLSEQAGRRGSHEKAQDNCHVVQRFIVELLK